MTARPAHVLLVAVNAIAAFTVLLSGPVASPAPAATGDVAGATLRVVDQPTGVEIGQRATLVVAFAGAPADAELDATFFPPVTGAGVRDAEQGRLSTRQVGFLPRAPVATLTNPDGTASLSLRVVAEPPRLDEEVRLATPGIYPVRIRLLAQGGESTLAQLVTFLIRPQGTKLPITVVLGLPGSPALQPDGTTAVTVADQAHVQAVTGLLTDLPDFPFAVAPRPELLAALSRTNPVLMSRLATTLGSRAVLAMPFVRLDVRGMVGADLVGEVGRQLALGEQAVVQALPGTRPDRRVWYVDGPLDDASLDVLRTLGVQHLLVEPARLEPAPASPTLRPLRLATAAATTGRSPTDAGTGLAALAADADLSARTEPTHDVTAAVVNLVAELSALAFGEGVGRGLVVLPPRDWTVVTEFWTRLATALRGPGMVAAVGLDEFLRTTIAERDARTRLRPEVARNELPLAENLNVTRAALAQMGSVLPPGSRRFEGLTDRTTVAASADLTDAERTAYFGAVTERVNPVRASVTVRVRARITVAGKNGDVPLSLVNSLDEAVTVRLRLASDKLRVNDNERLVTVPAKGELPLRVKVEARTSAWEFPVSVHLTTPDGSEDIGTPTPLQLRAVGLSGLGLGISFGALTVLATWWITHARRRRRARRRAAATLVSP